MGGYRTEYLRSYIQNKINQGNDYDDDVFMCAFTCSELQYFLNLLDLKVMHIDDINELVCSFIEEVVEIEESLQQYAHEYDLPLSQQVDLNYILYSIEGLKIHCKQHIKE